MACIFDVVYPNRERAYAVGYPVAGTTVRVDVVPRGPLACLDDELEIDFAIHPSPVLRIVGGPRRPTILVRLPDSDEAARDRWMDAREADGWNTRPADDEDGDDVIYAVARRDDLDRAALAVDGAVVLGDHTSSSS